MELEHKWTEEERQQDKMLPTKKSKLQEHPMFAYLLTIVIQLMLFPVIWLPYAILAGNNATMFSNLTGVIGYTGTLGNLAGHMLVIYYFNTKGIFD